MTERAREALEDEHERKFRRIFAWVLFLGTCVACIIIAFFVFKSAFGSYDAGSGGLAPGYSGISPTLAEFLKQHARVTFGLPIAAVVSLLLILVLRESTGKLEFEALGFKFRGASGPVVLWVLCYLAMTLSIKLLW
jgi:hypothetical protein